MLAVDLSKASNIQAFPMGAIVIQEGAESPREMILVLQGNLGVYRNYRMNSEVQLRVIGQGSFHGEMSLFRNQEQKETLVALTQVIVLVITRKNVGSFFANQSDMAFTIVEGICKKLADANEELFKLTGGADTEAPSRRSALFPEGHGSYTLPLQNGSDIVYTAKTTCPLCGHSFDQLGIIQSKLKLDKTDGDLRPRYKGFEPMYYEITTCPNCFFSASAVQFEGANRAGANAVNQEVGPYKLEMYIRTGMERDTFTVFAGYYLALLCAPVVFDDHQLVTAALWVKIARLYQDCDDAKLYLYASEKALADYRYAYEHIKINERQNQQLCYMVGDLYFRLGDVDNARTFFFQAKASPDGSAVLKRQADVRLEEIRELKRSAATAH